MEFASGWRRGCCRDAAGPGKPCRARLHRANRMAEQWAHHRQPAPVLVCGEMRISAAAAWIMASRHGHRCFLWSFLACRRCTIAHVPRWPTVGPRWPGASPVMDLRDSSSRERSIRCESRGQCRHLLACDPGSAVQYAGQRMRRRATRRQPAALQVDHSPCLLSSPMSGGGSLLMPGPPTTTWTSSQCP